jgi:hypothetical protein
MGRRAGESLLDFCCNSSSVPVSILVSCPDNLVQAFVISKKGPPISYHHVKAYGRPITNSAVYISNLVHRPCHTYS